MKNQITKEEYMRRIHLLGISGTDKVPGFTSSFIPVDPQDSVFVGGYTKYMYGTTWAISKDGKHRQSGCGEQYCMGPCDICERNTYVLVEGVYNHLANLKNPFTGMNYISDDLARKAFDYLSQNQNK